MSRIVDALMSRAAFVLIVALALGYFAYDVGQSIAGGVALRCWNWPNITITVALILALYLARQIDERSRAALYQLWLQGTLPQEADPRAELQQRILAGRARKEAACALLIMLVMAAAYAWSEAPYVPDFVRVMQSPEVAAAVKTQLVVGFFGAVGLGLLAGLVAGAFFGRLATYGAMATVLAEPETRLNVRPGHFDGANGLKPVGDFYLYQALLTAIPLVWLAGWALILPWYYSAPCFGEVDPAFIWRVRWQFYGQWVVVASFTYFGFIRPVLALRRRLAETRDDLRRNRIPEIETEIARMKGTLGLASGNERRAIEAGIDELAREHWAIRNMSCWPMDRATFSKYAPVEIATNVAPVLMGPLLSVGDAQAIAQGPASDAVGAAGFLTLLKGFFF